MTYTFSEALYMLKSGTRMTRAGWNGKGMWVELQTPDEHAKMRLPDLYMCTVTGDLIPWVVSHSDMLASDWRMAT